LIFGGLLCGPTYLYLALREARKAPLLLSPLSFYFFWYSIGLGFSPLYVGIVTEPYGLVRFASEQSSVPLNNLATAYVVYLLGSVALHLGMELFRPPPRVEVSDRTSPRILWWLGLVWAGGLLFQLSPGSFSFLGSATKILSVSLVGSVCGLAVISREKLGLSRLGFFLALAVGTAGLLFGNLASGSKAYIMFSFLPIFWLFIMKPRLRVWTIALSVCLAAFYFAIVAPVVYTARERPLQEGEDIRNHMVESFDVWMKEKPEELSQSFVGDQLDQFLNRQFDSVPVGFIVGEVNSSGLLLGDTMKYASYAFIPRLLWPDKPTVTRGGWFTAYLGLFDTEADATYSIGMTAVGELYWNFGTLGVLVGMLGIGCLLGGLWRMAGADPSGKPLHMLLYVAVMLNMPDMAEAVTVISSAVGSLILFKAAFIAVDVVSGLRATDPSILPRFPTVRL
jgi:hypothetical protein